MSSASISAAPAADDAFKSAALVPGWWQDAARLANVDVSGLDPAAPITQRVVWAESKGLSIGGVLARQSTKMQHSIDDQVRECVQDAARKKIYVPPEYICTDVQSGRKSDREGLNRMRTLLEEERIRVLLVYKLSRLFRSAHRGFSFIQEEVVGRKIRAISVSQQIDTNAGDSWKLLTVVYGLSDESLLTAIADHVRTGQAGCFLKGYVTGAMTVGYRPVEAPGAGLDKLGKPRRIAAVDPDVAPLVVQAFQSVHDGMPMYLALQQWNDAGGPCDRRATTRRMTLSAFRRLLGNARYTGRWSFGRRRNEWQHKKDHVRQIDMPADQVTHLVREELRIVSDDLFDAVQRILEGLKLRPRGPRKAKQPQLWDLVTEVFHCAQCKVRFYSHGGRGRGMTCKRTSQCPCQSTLIREEAVRNVCQTLAEGLAVNGSLVAEIAVRASAVDAEGDVRLLAEAEMLRKQIDVLVRRVDVWMGLVADGSPEDQKATVARIRGARLELVPLREQLAHLESRRNRAAVPVTVAEVQAALVELEKLLVDGASGRLGADMVHRAAAAFRLLVGGRIEVHIEKRACRKWTNAYGEFRPQYVCGLPEALGGGSSATDGSWPTARAWLRRRSSREVLGPRVYQLMDVEGLSYRKAAKVLQSEGHSVKSGVVYQCRQRYYEMLGLPFPTKFKRTKKPPKDGSS